MYFSTKENLQVSNHILEIFADASGLCTNLAKIQCYPIQCEGVNLDFISVIGQAISSFPCTYLGLPLHFRKPTKSALLPLVQKIGKGYQDGKKGFMSYPGRELLEGGGGLGIKDLEKFG
jgi:hypothetical protein